MPPTDPTPSPRTRVCMRASPSVLGTPGKLRRCFTGRGSPPRREAPTGSHGRRDARGEPGCGAKDGWGRHSPCLQHRTPEHCRTTHSTRYTPPTWGQVSQSCPILCDPMNCSPPGSSIQGILQARALEWVPFPSPGDLPDPGIEPTSPSLQVDSLPSEPPEKLENTGVDCLSLLPGIKPRSPTLQLDSLPFEPPGTPSSKQPVPKPSPLQTADTGDPSCHLCCFSPWRDPRCDLGTRGTLTPQRTVVQVEQKAAHVLVIHFPSSVCFILRNNLERQTWGEVIHDQVSLAEHTQFGWNVWDLDDTQQRVTGQFLFVREQWCFKDSDLEILPQL